MPQFTTSQDYEQYRQDNPQDPMLLRTGNGKRYKPVPKGIFATIAWIDSLIPEDRQRLATEINNEKSKKLK